MATLKRKGTATKNFGYRDDGSFLYSFQYFDWQWRKLAWATGAYWKRIQFEDAEYKRLFLGLYWEVRVYGECSL